MVLDASSGVVLNVGSRQGLRKGAILSIWRENVKMGTVRVTQVSAEDSDAEVVENIGGIRPGDRVIFPFKTVLHAFSR